ncbi:hypothetical protein V1289_009844 [Bradyrhizobium sp. AZCC 2289]
MSALKYLQNQIEPRARRSVPAFSLGYSPWGGFELNGSAQGAAR